MWTRQRRPRVVVVTGASSGVGRAVARAFGQRGDRVALMARNSTALERAAEEVRDVGGEPLTHVIDVADPDAVEEAAEHVVERWGSIDVWVNNAMVTVFAPVHATRPEEYRRVTEVTYLGTVYGTLSALGRMRAAGQGVIIQIGSALAYRSIPLQSSYCAAKAAIRGFTDSLRCELLHEGSPVRVTMLQLPAVNTPQFDISRNHMRRRPQPVPPIYQPEVVGRAAVHAADHPARELWVGGSTYKAIWGQRIAPGLLDRYLAREAYGAQLTSEPDDPERQDNLDAPVPGDRGSHGRFDSSSRPRSVQLWGRIHRLALGGGVLGAGLAGASLLGLKRRRGR